MDESAEFAPLLVDDLGPEILDFNHALAHEDYLRDFGNSRDPGIAKQVWVEVGCEIPKAAHEYFAKLARKGGKAPAQKLGPERV